VDDTRDARVPPPDSQGTVIRPEILLKPPKRHGSQPQTFGNKRKNGGRAAARTQLRQAPSAFSRLSLMGYETSVRGVLLPEGTAAAAP